MRLPPPPSSHAHGHGTSKNNRSVISHTASRALRSHLPLTLCMWRVHVCDMTRSQGRVKMLRTGTPVLLTKDWWKTWLFHACDMTCVYMWHDAFTCVTWLIRTYINRDADSRTKMTWVIYMCHVACSYLWHDALMWQSQKTANWNADSPDEGRFRFNHWRWCAGVMSLQHILQRVLHHTLQHGAQESCHCNTHCNAYCITLWSMVRRSHVTATHTATRTAPHTATCTTTHAAIHCVAHTDDFDSIAEDGAHESCHAHTRDMTRSWDTLYIYVYGTHYIYI